MQAAHSTLVQSQQVEQISQAIKAGNCSSAKMQAAEYVERFGLDGHFGDQIKEFINSLDKPSQSIFDSNQL